MQFQQGLQFGQSLAGVARRHQLDHIKGISVQRDGAKLLNHSGSDGGIATERCQLGDLILQQKLVVAAAVQQGGFGTGGKGGVILPCPSAGHLLQGRRGRV